MMSEAANNSISPTQQTSSLRRQAETAGVGTIGRKTAWVLCILFLLSMTAPGAYQIFYDEHVLGRSQFDDLLMNWPTVQSLSEFEKNLTAQSQFNRSFRGIFWRWQDGGIKPPGDILVGADGFLFHAWEASCYSSQSLVAPAPALTASILPTIQDFAAQLQEKGIRLILLPIPFKISIYPDELAIDYRLSDGPAYPPGYQQWMTDVRKAGVDLIDLTPTYWKDRDPSNPVFWPSDHHWSARGRSIAADAVADYLRPLVRDIPQISLQTVPKQFDEEGDLARFLSLNWGNSKYLHNQWTSQAVFQNGQPLVPEDEAQILLIGDSYTGYYVDDGCGFSDELMQRLKVEVQAIGCNGEPITKPREILAGQPATLKAKKILIWEFAGHSLWDTWRKINLN